MILRRRSSVCDQNLYFWLTFVIPSLSSGMIMMLLFLLAFSLDVIEAIFFFIEKVALCVQ